MIHYQHRHRCTPNPQMCDDQQTYIIKYETNIKLYNSCDMIKGSKIYKRNGCCLNPQNLMNIQILFKFEKHKHQDKYLQPRCFYRGRCYPNSIKNIHH